MTSKEKAKELVDKMEKDFQYFASREIAIKHALIAVEFSIEFITGDLSEAFDKFLYIQDVKEEIEKL
jgi:uncharacterized protein (DUF2164 family)